jgi:hypothetical protein
MKKPLYLLTLCKYYLQNSKKNSYLSFLFFAIISMWQPVFAQTMYVVLLADGSEHKHNGHYYNLQRLQLETDTIANFANLEKKEFIIDEKLLTRYAIDSVFSQIRPSKKDVFFVYFSGTEYLQKVLHTDKQVLKLQDTYIEYELLQKKMKAKNAKLSILIVDLCNTISTDRIVSKLVLPAKSDKYKKLFQEAEGEIFAINHFPYEQHELITTTDGTIFTNGFVHALHEDRKDNRWEAVISRAKYLTISESAGKQNPQTQVMIKNTEPEGQNFNAPNSYPEGQASTDKTVRLRPNDNNGNFVSPNNTNATQQKSSNNKGGNFDKKSDKFAENITSDTQVALKDISLATVSNLQDKIARIALGSSSNEAGKGEVDLIESAMLLFSDNTKEIGISSVRRGVVRKKVKKYFRKLYGIGNAYKISVSWYQPTELETMQVQIDGSYQAIATVYQEFRKTNKEGKLIYGDRVSKKISLRLSPDASEKTGWKVLIEDIEVVKGSTEEIKE